MLRRSIGGEGALANIAVEGVQAPLALPNDDNRVYAAARVDPMFRARVLARRDERQPRSARHGDTADDQIWLERGWTVTPGSSATPEDIGAALLESGLAMRRTPSQGRGRCSPSASARASALRTTLHRPLTSS